MRTHSRQALSTTLLIAGAAIFLVSSSLGASALAVVGLLCVAGGVVTLYGGERGLPSASDTEVFLRDLLSGRGLGGAFELKDVRHEVFTGGARAKVLVRFSARVVFTEPLYRPADPPPTLFEGFNPRRLSWIRKVIAQLVAEKVPGAAELRARMPADPYQRRHVGVRTAKGAHAAVSGSAHAAQRREQGWAYELIDLGGSLGTTADTGEPVASFPDPLILNNRESERWIRETIVAWRTYEREVHVLREKVELARADRAARALEEFFNSVKAGVFFHGTGETASRQAGPAHFFLEVISVDAAARGIVFTLRNDGTWRQARQFTGHASYLESDHVVEINATTKAEDAFSNGGPVIGSEGAFSMRFRFTPGVPARLAAHGGDLLLILEEVPREALEKIRVRAYARRQRITEAIAPGTSYAGNAMSAKGDEPLGLTFVTGPDCGVLMARIESAGWSGLFHVQEGGNRYDSDGHDFLLEPVITLGGDRPADPRSPEAWRRIALSVEEDVLVGRVEAPGQPIRLRVRRIGSGHADVETPARREEPESVNVAGSAEA